LQGYDEKRWAKTEERSFFESVRKAFAVVWNYCSSA
jgi:hypothetical protein